MSRWSYASLTLGNRDWQARVWEEREIKQEGRCKTKTPGSPNFFFPFGDQTPACTAVGWLPQLHAGLADHCTLRGMYLEEESTHSKEQPQQTLQAALSSE